MTEQYKCPSYYDANSVLQDCTCGKCGSKADWLRSEIEKLEGMKKDPSKGRLSGDMMFLEGFNQALTSIITRYKEELLELESTK